MITNVRGVPSSSVRKIRVKRIKEDAKTYDMNCELKDNYLLYKTKVNISLSLSHKFEKAVDEKGRLDE